MDGTTDPTPFAQAGYAITGSGGGGSGGQYLFANLDELNSIITDLETLRDNIRNDGEKLRLAHQLITPPAEDDMSHLEAQSTLDSLVKAIEHNDAMIAYADAEIAKIQAARNAYVNTDHDGAERLRHIDEG